MLKNISKVFLVLVALGMTACSEDSPTEVGDGQVLMSGGCAGRSSDRSITCQDNSEVTGKDASIISITFDFQLGGVSRKTLQAGTTLPPRQVTATGFDLGTWTIIHTLRGRAGGQDLKGDRSYVVTLLAQSTVVALIAGVDAWEQAGRGNDGYESVMGAIRSLPLSTQDALYDYVRKEYRVNLRAATPAEIDRVMAAEGGAFGVRTKALLFQYQ